MKNTKKRLNKFLSVFLALTIVFSMFSGLGLTASAAISKTGKVADLSTMDSWKDLFPTDNTEQAGRIWTDKSVFTNANEFQSLKDVNGGAARITMTNADDNFLIALSALASNKSIVGYSHIPTDTVLVLDISGSMGPDTWGSDNNDAVSDLVLAANAAITKLLDLNKNNRIGVVLYSAQFDEGNDEHYYTLLPIDSYSATQTVTYNGGTRYDTSDDVTVGKFLETNDNYSHNGNEISIASGVSTTKGKVEEETIDVVGGTFIQGGLKAATDLFKERADANDTVIADGGFQAGTQRKPIMVLMSDGAPTYATTDYTNPVEPNKGNGKNTYESYAFLTQLSATYLKNKITEYYNDNEALFYTLGLGVGNSAVAESVLDPQNSTSTIDDYWEVFSNAEENASIEVAEDIWVVKDKSVTDIVYANQYFEAETGADLFNAFDNIVNEIIIQSLYYPTNVDNGDHDHDGYVEFIDDIGHYMDVKDVKGITIGDTLFTGERLAKNFTPTGGELINPDGSYSDLGDNMVWSVMDRLGIATAQDARDLINSAYEAGQLRYYSEDNWSNYIGWYADDDGKFLGHWNDSHTAKDIPTGATYINKSYGMLGEVTSEHTATDMMYVSTQVHTRIFDGNVSFIWRIPASLIPVVSYNITLNGETIKGSTESRIEYVAAEPIRIIFEVGLKDEITAVNLNEKIEDKDAHIIDVNEDDISDDGKYYFYTNWWSDGGLTHVNPPKVEDTIVFFEPSIQNERYYYAEETTVYLNIGTEENPVCTLYKGAMPKVSDGNSYYREYAVFVDDTIKFQYEKMSDDTISVLKPENQNEDGSWDIPIGTVHRVLEPYNLPKDREEIIGNLTDTLEYVRYPVIEEIPEKDSFYIGSILGNNGRIAVDIPQGIKISKVVDNTLYGTDETFSFTVNVPGAEGVFEAYKESASGKPSDITVEFIDGITTVPMKAGESVYILGIDDSIVCTVTENINGDYKVSNVKVNGIEQSGTIANVIVEQYALSEVVFENTLDVNRNTIVISKEVEYDSQLDYDEDKVFSFVIYKENKNNPLAEFELKAGETKPYDALEDGTYIIEEIDTKGFKPRNKEYTIEVSNGAVASVHFINEYTPQAVVPKITVSGTKTLSGRPWQENDSFNFKLQKLVGANWEDVGERAVAFGDSDYDFSFDFANDTNLKQEYVTFDTVGTHYYRVFEVVPNKEDKIGGITYDETYRYFRINVTDADMDGELECEVVGSNAVTVSQSGSEYKVEAELFENIYKAGGIAEVTIQINKTVDTPDGIDYSPEGFEFGVYEYDPITEKVGDLLTPIHTTDVSGKTQFTFTYNANGVDYQNDKVYNYAIVENDTGLGGITYAQPIPFVVTVEDNLDGTISATTNIDNTNNNVSVVAVTNVYNTEEIEVVFEATKNITGRELKDGEFKFDLIKKATMSVELDDVVNDANGNITFSRTFNKVGTYKYIVLEDEVDGNGVKVDTTEHEVTIVVDHDGKGNLTATVNGTEFTGTAINVGSFTNIYTPNSANVTLEATKKLEGRDLAADEFVFELYDKDGKLVETVKNASDGKIAFAAITVDKAGEYTYTVKEVKGNAEGITYDQTVYTVTVTVTDNGDGTLKVEYAYKDQDGKAANGIVFENKYTPKPAEPTPEPPAEPAPEPPAEPTPEPPAEPASPKTGDIANPFLWFAVMFVSGGITFATGRKLRRLNK